MLAGTSLTRRSGRLIVGRRSVRFPFPSVFLRLMSLLLFLSTWLEPWLGVALGEVLSASGNTLSSVGSLSYAVLYVFLRLRLANTTDQGMQSRVQSRYVLGCWQVELHVHSGQHCLVKCFA
jgi:hypothetical protein